MQTVKIKMMASMRAMTLAAMLLSGAAGVGVFTPQTAEAQVKSVADVKTMLKPELPAGALEITAAMKSAKIGETITVRGNVAMSKDAFVENRAMFTLVDESTRKGCCPPSEKLPDTACDIPAEGRATIQIVGANGKPLRASLNGEHGLKPGAEVFITGKVESANGTDALVLTAVSMHVPKAPLLPVQDRFGGLAGHSRGGPMGVRSARVVNGDGRKPRFQGRQRGTNTPAPPRSLTRVRRETGSG